MQKAYPVEWSEGWIAKDCFQCHLYYTQEYDYQSSEKRGVGVKAKIINYYYFH